MGSQKMMYLFRDINHIYAYILQERNIGVVNVQADDQLEQLHFDTRRAWNIKVTQIPCGCSDIETPKAPRGCLAYYTGFSGDLKSFNYDGFSCYR